MTMSDIEPTPDFSPVSPELYDLDLLLAMKFLHEFQAKAAQDDQATLDHRLSLLSNEVSLEMRPFLQFCVPDDTNPPMTCNYHQMLLRPARGSEARKRVYEIIARFPYFSDAEQPFDLPNDTAYWNDVSLELGFVDGSTYRYWLNARGIAAYKDADALDVDPNRSDDDGDLFAVQPGKTDETAPVLTGKELRLFLKQSEAKTQANDPDDE